jgi:asparagine synthase (glutamine-hydrolysing)
MRRSLVGIVPDEILNRKRKAYVVRGPRTAILAHWADVQALTHDMIAESLGIVSSVAFRRALDDAREGKELAILPVQRMLQLESWLRNLSHRVVLGNLGAEGTTFAACRRSQHRQTSFS